MFCLWLYILKDRQQAREQNTKTLWTSFSKGYAVRINRCCNCCKCAKPSERNTSGMTSDSVNSQARSVLRSTSSLVRPAPLLLLSSLSTMSYSCWDFQLIMAVIPALQDSLALPHSAGRFLQKPDQLCSAKSQSSTLPTLSYHKSPD